VVFSTVKEMVDLEKDGLDYFRVKFKPPKLGFEKALEDFDIFKPKEADAA